MIRKFASSLAAAAVLLLAGCMSPPVGLDLATSHPTENKLYVIDIAPQAAPLPLNKLHSWTVHVTNATGAPVLNAKIDVDGGMPQHGHGFPTRPRVTRELGDGNYLLEGVKFSMTGWWEIKLAINAAPGVDKVVFNTVVQQPGQGK